MWIDYRKGWCCKAFTSPSASTSFLIKVELRDAAIRELKVFEELIRLEAIE
jgi:hypothetical protein